MIRHSAFARATLIAGCCLAPLAAAAQTAGTNSGAVAIEEVVVTARKQGETLLDAPATISVLQTQAIAAANITNATQLSGIVPGLIVMQGTAGASSSLRGLGSTSADPSMENSVPTFSDGIYLGHPRDFILPVYDVAQVEFIKGTQSTLLGKNSSLGAISISSRKPRNAFGYDLALTRSGGIDGKKLEGGVDLPLGGGFAVRLAGVFNDEDGYVHNLNLGDKERRVNETSQRVVLTGPLGHDGDLTVLYQHDSRQTDGHYMELLSDPNGVVTRRALALGQTNFDAVGNDKSFSGSDAVGAGATAGPLQFDNQSGDRLTAIGVHDLGRYALTAQTAWVQWDSLRATDMDLTRAQLLDLYDHEKNWILSQEIRLASPVEDRFSWLAGVFLYENNWRLVRRAKAQTGGGVYPLAGTTAGDILVKTDAWSAFGAAHYALSDKIKVSAGLRYTDEDKTPTYERVSTGFFALPSQSPNITKTTLGAKTAKKLDGDLGVQYRPDGNTMLYVSWSKGSKSGGFQTSPVSLAGAAFEGETAYTLEAGAKFDFPGRGYLTTALFDTRVDGFQVSRVEVVDGLAQSVISNADIGGRGAEASGSWRLGAVTFNANAVYSVAEFRKDFGTAGALVAYKGMPLPRAPKWSGSLGARYSHSLNDRLSLRLQGAAAYNSDADLQLRSTDPLSPKSKAHTLLDGQIALADAQGGWELAVIGTNLADKRYTTFASSVTAGGSAYWGTLNRPRVIALQLKFTR